MTKQNLHRIRSLLWAFGASAGVVLVVAGSTFAYVHIRYGQTIAPNVHVASVSLAGLTPDQAKAALQTAIDAIAATSVTFAGEKIEESLTPEKLEIVYDVDATVAAAFAVGRNVNPLITVIDQLQLLVGQPINQPLVVSFTRQPVDETLNRVTSELGNPVHNATLTRDKHGVLGATTEKAGTAINVETVIEVIETRLRQLDANRTIPVVFTERAPMITKADVERLIPTLTPLVNTPVTLTLEKHDPIVVDANTVTTWIGFVLSTNQSDHRWVFAEAPATEATVGIVQASIDETALRGYLRTIAKQVAQEAVDAKLTITDGRAAVFQASQSGRSLNVDVALSAIAEAFVARAKTTTPTAALATKTGVAGSKAAAIVVVLPVATIEPTISESSINSLGINQLIGFGQTDFSGSPDNRVHNITVGTKYITGRLVKPGEEFSTVSALGAVDASTGYLPELVIKENKTIPEFGGGLCQVSTTLFRAVMNAGLPVVERTNHSYRVVYYERGVGPGLDATVYLPKPDFKFKNDTPNWVLVQGSITGKTLKFELYGTSDGRVANIDGPHTLATQNPAPDILTPDPSLQPGEKKQVAFAHQGATTTATYTVTRDGKEINRQVFNSKYSAMPAEFKVGPDAPPADQPVQ